DRRRVPLRAGAGLLVGPPPRRRAGPPRDPAARRPPLRARRRRVSAPLATALQHHRLAAEPPERDAGAARRPHRRKPPAHPRRPPHARRPGRGRGRLPSGRRGLAESAAGRRRHRARHRRAVHVPARQRCGGTLHRHRLVGQPGGPPPRRRDRPDPRPLPRARRARPLTRTASGREADAPGPDAPRGANARPARAPCQSAVRGAFRNAQSGRGSTAHRNTRRTGAEHRTVTTTAATTVTTTAPSGSYSHSGSYQPQYLLTWATKPCSRYPYSVAAPSEVNHVRRPGTQDRKQATSSSEQANTASVATGPYQTGAPSSCALSRW